jgi:protein disulfide-isomerase A1
VVIAKLDGTENEHADIDVKGFPTILLFPAEAGAAPITFSGGDRSLAVGGACFSFGRRFAGYAWV